MNTQATYEIVTKEYRFQDGFIAGATNFQNVPENKIRFLQTLTANGATADEAKANLEAKIQAALK